METSHSHALLPLFSSTAKDLVELIGPDPAMALFSKFGGTTLSVPEHGAKYAPAAYERLTEIVGCDAADAICARYGQRNIGLYIPRLAKALNAERLAAMLSRFDELRVTMSKLKAITQMVGEYGVSERHVSRLLSAARRKHEPNSVDADHFRTRSEIDSIDADLIALVPESAIEIADVIGVDSALRLCAALGGSIVYFHRVNSARNGMHAAREKLSTIVGDEAATALQRHFATESIYIPMLRSALTSMRNRTILRDFDRKSKAMTASDAVAHLARQFQMSDRQIWRVLKHPSPPVATDTSARRTNLMRGVSEPSIRVQVTQSAISLRCHGRRRESPRAAASRHLGGCSASR